MYADIVLLLVALSVDERFCLIRTLALVMAIVLVRVVRIVITVDGGGVPLKKLCGRPG